MSDTEQSTEGEKQTAPQTAPQTEQQAEQPAEPQAEQPSPFRLASLTEEEPAAATEGTPAAVTEEPPAAVPDGTPPVEPAGFPDLGPDLGTGATPNGGPRAGTQALDIRLLSDIPLEVTVELGRAVLTVNQLLALRPGSVVELTAGASTVDVVVNGRLVARGDVVVVGDSFGVRVTEIVEP
jgi:flagellar motor switch protein FliN/FliY